MKQPILIAHRGLLDGPDALTENNPKTIKHARSMGFDVEIDLWYKDGGWFLGHDAPTYQVNLEWLKEIDQSSIGLGFHAWIHAKNIPALYELQKMEWPGHVFYHQNDDVTLTSSGYLWTYPGRELTPFSIAVMPEWVDMLNENSVSSLDCWGICTDFVTLTRDLLRR